MSNYIDDKYSYRGNVVIKRKLEELKAQADMQKLADLTPKYVDKIVSDGGSTTYYDIPEGARDLLDLIDHKGMSFSISNIFKACYRFGEKADVDKAYDLRKIIFFAQRELDKLKETT